MDIPSKFSIRSGLLGLGVTALSTAYKLGRRAYLETKKDPPFPTSTNMPKRVYPSRKVSGRRYRRPAIVRPMRSPVIRSMRRCNANSLRVSLTGAGVAAGYIASPTLNDIPTADLLSAYRMYRIKKVVFTLAPRMDPANGAVANHWQFQCTAACNPEGPVVAPTTINDMSIYDNWYSKHIVSGERFVYTFYPKVTNSVQGSATAVASGSYRTNPWLKLDSTGIQVPHQQLLILVQSGIGPGASTVNFDGYFTIYFDVMS